MAPYGRCSVVCWRKRYAYAPCLPYPPAFCADPPSCLGLPASLSAFSPTCLQAAPAYYLPAANLMPVYCLTQVRAAAAAMYVPYRTPPPNPNPRRPKRALPFSSFTYPPHACSPAAAAAGAAPPASAAAGFVAEGSARGATSCRRMSQLNATPSSANTAPVMGQNQWNAWGRRLREGGSQGGGIDRGGRREGGRAASDGRHGAYKGHRTRKPGEELYTGCVEGARGHLTRVSAESGVYALSRGLAQRRSPPFSPSPSHLTPHTPSPYLSHPLPTLPTPRGPAHLLRGAERPLDAHHRASRVLAQWYPRV